MVNRYLITTADERSWKFDCPVLFLGEECRRYDRKHIWSVMDAIVTEPYNYNADFEQKLRDIDHVQSFARQILTELTEALNEFHQTQYSERYWNIVLGHWLQRYVAVAFNRYYTLDKVLENNKVTGTTIFEAKDYSLATTDSSSFIHACTDDLWNHVLYSRLLAYRGDVELNVVSISLHGLKVFSHERKKQNGLWARIKMVFRELVYRIGPKLARNTDAVIINTYLPLNAEIKLQLALGQAPQLWQLWSGPSFERTLPNADLRSNIVLNYGKYEGFRGYTLWQLPEVIPTCYLEGYKSLAKKAEELPWPEKPRFIFTSNNFDTDEIFKIWTASKVEQGIPYFTGQHGNNYGTHIYLDNKDWPERATADKFFTWGWTDESENCVPAFIFKTATFKPQVFDPKGGVLLIELPPPHRYTPVDSYYEYGLYQEEQFRFVESLPDHIHRQLTVRLHLVCKELPWSDEQRWKDRSPDTQLETGVTPIRKLINRNRLVVHSYDSTGLLETLSLNIPTMCFWRGGLDHLLTTATPYYELLRNAGILITIPERAAKMVALHWDNVGKWWQSQEVQTARKTFIGQFARMEKYPIRVLKKLLTQDEKKT